jgi:asparagine synthase (glutamine-hydrolysing)
MRGKSGIHIDARLMQRSCTPLLSSSERYLLPGVDNSTPSQELYRHELMKLSLHKAVISGIGGDEILGGVPTPYPELADALITLNLSKFFGSSIEWCIATRSPLLKMAWKALGFTFDLYDGKVTRRPHASLLASHLGDALRPGSLPESPHVNPWTVCPSAVTNGRAWWAIMETLPHLVPENVHRPEFRYPFLDRDLVDFLFRVPPGQLVRAGRRRCLMRRALKGIVPEEILERRRKAYCSRSSLAFLTNHKQDLHSLLSRGELMKRGYISPDRLDTALGSNGSDKTSSYSTALLRAICLELWLRHNEACDSAAQPKAHIIAPIAGAEEFRIRPAFT